MNNKYYVYVYFDPRAEPPEPIYVGKGYGKRSNKHLKNSHNKFLARKIDKILKAGLEVLILKPYENCSCDEALEFEKQLIKQYGRKNIGAGTLCNFTDGGEGTEGYKHNEETLKLFSEQRKGKLQTAAQYAANCERTVKEASRKKMSESNKGHKRHSIKQIQKLIEFNTGNIPSQETRDLWSQQRKGVKQSPEHIANTQLSIKRGRYLKEVFNNNTITIDELEEYNIRIERRSKKNK